MEIHAKSNSETAFASIAKDKHKILIHSHGHSFFSDESEESGGHSLGMNPLSLLLSSLAACTVATIKRYADNRSWHLDGAEVKITFKKVIQNESVSISKEITLHGKLSHEQKIKLQEIGSHSAVHQILTNNVFIDTELSE
ncbi:OsmC family protein [Flavobacterium psychroterrae]|uniref:OsmC family protein n=1 Tax=Flavobacterium psychroterrae TaxID=2133767 RepID=A0ABS5PGG9_9FLAO|nr:OsmC family protein [Flavobacterium psychroterrae]MBS7233379.1 OsmC family protein [Flavobacterium psychroterrae]